MLKEFEKVVIIEANIFKGNINMSADRSANILIRILVPTFSSFITFIPQIKPKIFLCIPIMRKNITFCKQKNKIHKCLMVGGRHSTFFLLGIVSKLLAVIKLGRYGNIAVRLYGLY